MGGPDPGGSISCLVTLMVLDFGRVIYLTWPDLTRAKLGLTRRLPPALGKILRALRALPRNQAAYSGY
jgi:hypothetical protein